MSDYTNYAQFGTATFEGGVVSVKLINGSLAITLIHNARGDAYSTKNLNGLHQLTISFWCDDKGILALHERGYLPLGRRMTVTGKILDVSQVYTNDEGETLLKKRPEIKLDKVSIPDGALGPCPKREEMPRTAGQVIASKPVPEKAPTLEPQEF